MASAYCTISLLYIGSRTSCIIVCILCGGISYWTRATHKYVKEKKYRTAATATTTTSESLTNKNNISNTLTTLTTSTDRRKMLGDCRKMASI